MYAAIDYGGLYRYNGLSWTTIKAPTNEYDTDKAGLWGSSPLDIFMVGNHDTRIISHFNGINFQDMTYPADGWYLNGVWGTSNSNVYAVGGDGTVVHYNGTIWQSVNIEDKRTINPIPAFQLLLLE